MQKNIYEMMDTFQNNNIDYHLPIKEAYAQLKKKMFLVFPKDEIEEYFKMFEEWEIPEVGGDIGYLFLRLSIISGVKIPNLHSLLLHVKRKSRHILL